jgi:hypothetical protein
MRVLASQAQHAWCLLNPSSRYSVTCIFSVPPMACTVSTSSQSDESGRTMCSDARPLSQITPWRRAAILRHWCRTLDRDSFIAASVRRCRYLPAFAVLSFVSVTPAVRRWSRAALAAGADLRHVILHLGSNDAYTVVIQAWGATSTFDLFQFTDKHPNPLVPRRQSQRISLRIRQFVIKLSPDGLPTGCAQADWIKHR